MMDREEILNTLLWLHNEFEIPIKRDWFKKGINSIADFLGIIKVSISMEEFTNIYGVKMNILEFNDICFNIRKFLEWRDYPLYCETLPRYSTINIPIKLSLKGCSRLYSKIKDSNDHVLHNIVTKCNNKTVIALETSGLGRSFTKHHINNKDTYLKYIQFRTLHYRFFINDKFFIMGIKKSNLCGMCKLVEDSIEQLLLECDISRKLWAEVRDWIVELGMADNHFTNNRIIKGDL